MTMWRWNVPVPAADSWLLQCPTAAHGFWSCPVKAAEHLRKLIEMKDEQPHMSKWPWLIPSPDQGNLSSHNAICTSSDQWGIFFLSTLLLQHKIKGCESMKLFKQQRTHTTALLVSNSKCNDVSLPKYLDFSSLCSLKAKLTTHGEKHLHHLSLPEL